MMYATSILQFILLTPVVGAICVSAANIFVGQQNVQEVQKSIALIASLLTFIASLVLWVLFDTATPEFQFVTEFRLGMPKEITASSNLGNQLSETTAIASFGVDGVSLLLVVLTCLLIPICILLTWEHGFTGGSLALHNHNVELPKKQVTGSFGRLTNVKLYLVSYLLLQSLLIGAFTALDLLVFYILFESVLLPMYFIIGVWGSRERKIRAAYQFFLYTLFGSLFMLLGILMLYFQTGSTDVQTLYMSEISESRQLLLWLALFFSFAVKVPMIPVHLWLPEAHVEAPTSGSVILAGVLLKLGTYGFIRYSLPILPYASWYFAPVVSVLSVLAIVYASLTTLRQVDLKKIIAYSSVAHMGFVTLGVFAPAAENSIASGCHSSLPLGIEAGLFLMLSHGVVSSGLFLCVGVLYERHKTRLLQYYGGLAQVMPMFSCVFLLFILANLSLPMTSNFIGEFMVLLNTYDANTILGVFAATGMVFGAAYSIWMYNRVVFGTSPKMEYLTQFADVHRRETFALLPLLILVFWMGIYPESFLQVFHSSVIHIANSYT